MASFCLWLPRSFPGASPARRPAAAGQVPLDYRGFEVVRCRGGWCRFAFSFPGASQEPPPQGGPQLRDQPAVASYLSARHCIMLFCPLLYYSFLPGVVGKTLCATKTSKVVLYLWRPGTISTRHVSIPGKTLCATKTSKVVFVFLAARHDFSPIVFNSRLFFR